MSSINNDEERVMYLKSENMETMTNHKPNEFIEKLFQSLLYRYQVGLET